MRGTVERKGRVAAESRREVTMLMEEVGSEGKGGSIQDGKRVMETKEQLLFVTQKLQEIKVEKQNIRP